MFMEGEPCSHRLSMRRSKVAVLEEAVLIMQNKLNNQRQQYRESEAKFKEEKNELLATVRQQTEEVSVPVLRPLFPSFSSLPLNEAGEGEERACKSDSNHE